MRLKELRKENKKTQLELAELLHTTSQSYGRYELETSEPTIDTLCKLADYYGVSLDYLIGRDYSSEFSYLTEQEKIIVATFRKMTDENKLRYIAEGQGILIGQN